MPDFSDRDTPSVTVWLRDGDACTIGVQEEILSRLRELEAHGTIESLTVNRWSRRITCEQNNRAGGSDAAVRRRLAEFRAWAADEGHELEPAFERCETTSLVSDERREVVVLPTVCLELRSRGDLLAVFPCRSEGEVDSVWDCLDRLESVAASSEPPEPVQSADTPR